MEETLRESKKMGRIVNSLLFLLILLIIGMILLNKELNVKFK